MKANINMATLQPPKDNSFKKSAMRKLIPATSMLLVSAVMLASSTYAWFTMSRDVEVTGIKMTATVPEDLQISPGWTTSDNSGHNDDATYAINGEKSFLSSGTIVKGTYIAADPSATDMQMWTNALQLNHYYTWGRIIPASSTSGASLFFTPNATDAGKKVQNNAQFYKAVGQTGKDNLINDSGTDRSWMTTLHQNTLNGAAWGMSGTTAQGSYSGASSWSVTNDDGYYIDIPIWIRSSKDADTTLSVQAQAKWNTTTTTGAADVELYKAVRVVVIPDTINNNNPGTAGLIPVRDGSGTGAKYTGSSIVDFYGASGSSGMPSGAVKAAGNMGGSVQANGTSNAPTPNNVYGTAQMYTEGQTVVTIPAHTSNDTTQYGTATKVWIRVWLEGEDPECWNQNAGQDFVVDLKFINTNADA